MERGSQGQLLRFSRLLHRVLELLGRLIWRIQVKSALATSVPQAERALVDNAKVILVTPRNSPKDARTSGRRRESRKKKEAIRGKRTLPHTCRTILIAVQVFSCRVFSPQSQEYQRKLSNLEPDMSYEERINFW